MILKYFATNKNEIYGNEKLLYEMANSNYPIPPVGSLVIMHDEAYRVLDLCFEEDFQTVGIMMTLECK